MDGSKVRIECVFKGGDGKHTSTVVLKLECGSEAPGGFVKSQTARTPGSLVSGVRALSVCISKSYSGLVGGMRPHFEDTA